MCCTVDTTDYNWPLKVNVLNKNNLVLQTLLKILTSEWLIKDTCLNWHNSSSMKQMQQLLLHFQVQKWQTYQ